jgi:hypothetical protein
MDPNPDQLKQSRSGEKKMFASLFSQNEAVALANQ